MTVETNSRKRTANNDDSMAIPAPEAAGGFIGDLQDQEQWLKLGAGLQGIFDHKTITKKEYMGLYTTVYNICTRSDRNSQDALASDRENAMSAISNDGQPQLQQQALAGHELYKKLQEFIENHVKTVLEKTKTTLMSGDISETENPVESDQAILREYNTQWQRFLFSRRVFNGVAQYLNRYWVKRMREERPEEHVYEIKDLSLIVWKKHLFDHVNKSLTPTILRLVYRDRRGDCKIDYELIKGVVESYVELGLEQENQFILNSNSTSITRKTAFQQQTAALEESNLKLYKELFEGEFLKDLDIFYKQESDSYLTNHSVIDYMQFAQKRLDEERKRVDGFMHTSSMQQVMRQCTDALVKIHLSKIYAEFRPLLDQSRNEDLSRMYKLVQQADGLDTLKELLQEYILKKGQSQLTEIKAKAADDPRLYVNTLVDIHEKHRQLVCDCFDTDSNFRRSLDKACESFINDNALTKEYGSNKSPELLARHCDLLLRKGGDSGGDMDNAQVFERLMTIFEFLQDKDVFSKFYRNSLMKRLIHGTSVSDDDEELMISKLRDKCGYEFVAKFQRMMQDKLSNKTLNDAYKAFLTDKGKTQIDCSVQVLSQGSWPVTWQQLWDVKWPPVFQTCLDNFTEFYGERHTGRKLQWINNMCRADVVTNCFKKQYTFACSVFQAAVLLMFNSRDSYTVAEIQEHTGINKKILDQVIQLLLKVKLLVPGQNSDAMNTATSTTAGTQGSSVGGSQTPETPTSMSSSATAALSANITYADTDVVRLYTEYRNKRARININVPLKTDLKNEKEATTKSIEEDRKFEIQCCIVRVMKARKKLDHNGLITEAIEQLKHRFKPSVPAIKKGIDMLIEKEYLQRDVDDRNTYMYLA